MKLFYIVGASGSGKDSIIQYCREHLFVRSKLNIVVAHRYITRKSDHNENSVYLSEDEFDKRLETNLFSLAWNANGLSYGIGSELDHWLQSNCVVLVNGSREYLPTAQKKYGELLHSIEIKVPTKILEDRLANRKRESPEDIRLRLERHKIFSEKINPTTTIDNTASIEKAANDLFKTIMTYAV